MRATDASPPRIDDETDPLRDLARVSEILQLNKDRLVARWVEDVRRAAPVASKLDPRIVVDTLPSYLDLLVSAIADGAIPAEHKKVCTEHGERRAELRDYGVTELLAEYASLKKLTLELIDREPGTTPRVRLVLLQMLEEATSYAVGGLLRVHASRTQGLMAKAEQAGNLLGEILTAADDGVLAVDTEWRCIYLNPQANRILSAGLQSDVGDRLGKPMYESPPQGIPKLFWAQLEAREKRTAIHFTSYVEALDQWYAISVYPTDSLLTVYFRNVTDLQRATKALEQSDERFHYMVEAIRDYAIFMLDPLGNVASWNLGAERLKQYRAEEIVGQHFSRLYMPEDAAEGRPQINLIRAMVKGRTEDEWWRRRKDGSKFWANVLITTMYDSSGELRGYVKVIRDLSERKRDEEERAFLSDATSTLSSSLDLASTLEQLSAITVPALGDWCLIDVLGDGERHRRLVHPDPARLAVLEDLDRSYGPFLEFPEGPSKVLRTGQAVLAEAVEESTLAAFAQDPRHAELLRALGLASYLSVPLATGGRTIGALTIASADPERRYDGRTLAFATELGRRAALALDNAMLYREAKRALDMREVLSIVSHDLRNPLSAITTSAGILERGMAKTMDPEIARRHASVIKRSAGRMTRLINDLLDLSRLEAGRFPLQKTDIDVADLAAELLELFFPLVSDKEIRLESSVVPGTHLVGDSDRITQVLSNLLGNAIKFAPRNGIVTLGAEPAGDDVKLWVRDTGPGIAPEDLPHVFDRFWQAKDSGHLGAGLGLAIAKALVELHHGHIWAESTTGSGATFSFALPREPEDGTEPGTRVH
jgi:PAS domain S-box-containing protein